MKSITVNCNNIEISNNKKVCLIAGPCQLETEQHAMDMAGKIKEIATKFKIGLTDRDNILTVITPEALPPTPDPFKKEG